MHKDVFPPLEGKIVFSINRNTVWGGVFVLGWLVVFFKYYFQVMTGQNSP